jgi:hypothetical protein
VVLDPGRESLISSSGGLLLQRTVRLSGLDRSLSAALSGWRGRRTRHDPADVLISLAIAVALGGNCAADIAVVRAQPQMFGPVASDPTVSRLIAALAADIDVALPTIRAAHAAARGHRFWSGPIPAPAPNCSRTTSPTPGWSTPSGSRPATLVPGPGV